MTKELLKSIAMRFLRAFIAGAVASMVVVAPYAGHSWTDIKAWITMLSMALITGGSTGLIMAVDKWVRGFKVQ